MKQFYSLLRVICLLCPLILSSFFATCDDEPSNPPPRPIDSTSHSFTFQRDTIAVFGSAINDIFAISENDVWTVGQFYVKDSTGVVKNDPYNAAHWDGSRWEYFRIMFTLNYGNGDVFKADKSEIDAVFSPSPTEVWFSCAVGVTRLRNNVWEEITSATVRSFGGANKIWGSGSTDLYFASGSGIVQHWDGTTFRKIPSGYTADLEDIWGASKDEIYIAAADRTMASGYYGFLLRIENGQSKGVDYWGNSVMTCVWGMKGKWYASGCDRNIYMKEGTTWKPILHLNQCVAQLRGTSLNNIFFSAEGSILVHYNGSTFKEIVSENDVNGFIIPKAIACVGKKVFLIGRGSLPVVIRGTQQPIK